MRIHSLVARTTVPMVRFIKTRHLYVPRPVAITPLFIQNCALWPTDDKSFLNNGDGFVEGKGVSISLAVLTEHGNLNSNLVLIKVEVKQKEQIVYFYLLVCIKISIFLVIILLFSNEEY